MATLVLSLEYDGTDYNGWQIQPASKGITIQGRVEDALKFYFGDNLQIIGSGRTDTGVHAACQVVSVPDVTSRLTEDKIKLALNNYLPFDIRINKVFIFEEHFNARFDAIQREYVYNLTNHASAFNIRFSGYVKYQLDFELLAESAKIFIGEFDFTTFSKLNSSTQSYICDVLYSGWQAKDANNFQYKVVANRFVYGMVRSLVGVMIDVARKKRTIEEVQQALLAKDRNLCSPFAPASGLILNQVYYPEKFQILNK